MSKARIGISIQDSSPRRVLECIAQADALGVPAVWLATGGVSADALTLLAAAAERTKSIRLGTSIVPTFPRHPLVMVQQAEVIADLAPGRFVLGIGPSHKSFIDGTFGLPYERPLEHLREYVTIVKTSMETGAVEFAGKRFRVRGQVPVPAVVPVMISALRAKSFQLAGEIADGAISWICPAPYLRDVALPALAAGAQAANRAVPPLVAHAFVAVSEDTVEALRVSQLRVSFYPRLPFYAQMFAAAGYPEAQTGEWSEGMLKAVVIHGDEAAVADGLRSFVAISGASEMIASIVPVGPDHAASTERTMRLIASL